MKKNILTIGGLIITLFFMNCSHRDEIDSANTSYSSKDSSGIHHTVDSTHSNVDHSAGDQGVDVTDHHKNHIDRKQIQLSKKILPVGRTFL